MKKGVVYLSEIKGFDQIIQEITSGLSGDKKADITYLTDQIKLYMDHKYSKEIARACGRMIYDLLPEDIRAQYDKVVNNDAMGIDAILDETEFNIYKGNHEKAMSIIEPLVRKLGEGDRFKDDEVSEYRNFDELFETFLYMIRTKTNKTIRNPKVPFARIFFLYGVLLFEMGRYDDSKAALEKALKWNPVRTGTLFEYAEVFKAKGNFDIYLKITRDTFKVSFHKKDVARCLRNMGYYFIEKKLYSEAIGCYLLSEKYADGSKQVQSELYYINKISEGKAKTPTREELMECAKKYDFPLGADNEIIRLSYNYGKRFLKEKDMRSARYFFQIAYDLTMNPDVKKLLDQIPEYEPIIGTSDIG